MNCHEIAKVLEETLLRQRNRQWLQEAYRHAEQCPSCARRMALHRLEEQMTHLPAIQPSKSFVQSVMGQINRPQPIPLRPSPPAWRDAVDYAAISAGALALAAVYGRTAQGSWLSHLWPGKPWLAGLSLSIEPAGFVGTWMGFAYHPWALLLGAIGTLLIVFGVIRSSAVLRT